MDDRRAKLERLRAEGIDPFPHAFEGVVPIERVHAEHADLADGEETDSAYRDRRAPGRPPRARRRRLPGRGRPLGPAPGPRAQGRARRRGLRDARVARPRRPDRRRRHRLPLAPRRAQPQGHRLDAAREVAPQPARQVPRARGRGDALPPPRARPARQRGDARALHAALEGRERHPPQARRARLPRGGDAGAPAALRRRPGAPVRHAPQRAGPRPVPADRGRALPQAPDRRRARARLRDRQGLPERGRLPQAQPRVHDARVVRGLRGLRRHRDQARGADRVRGGGGGLRRPDRLLDPVAAREAASTPSATRPGST